MPIHINVYDEIKVALLTDIPAYRRHFQAVSVVETVQLLISVQTKKLCPHSLEDAQHSDKGMIAFVPIIV